MWNELTSCIKRVINDVFGEVKGRGKALFTNSVVTLFIYEVTVQLNHS